MIEALLAVIVVLGIANIILVLRKKDNFDIKPQLKELETLVIKFDSTLEKMGISIKDEFMRNRTETNDVSKANRDELSKGLRVFSEDFTKNVRDINDILKNNFSEFGKTQTELNRQSKEAIKEMRDSVERQLVAIREDNSKQLDEMRKTVDEKLQKTINDRLSQSFETVGKQLQSVQEGLGEMRNLASDVGGLKKVLSNVKLRGGIGEMQLSMLLEQILAPQQYEANVRTNPLKPETVEFAVKLPGRDSDDSTVWLPIDAKFPRDIYEKVQNSYEIGDQAVIQQTQKDFELTVKNMAKDIKEKYINPPKTTDFAIMFLPFEGIYAEVIRNSALLEDLQNKYKVIVTGPTTLAAILNSLQMGFKTLAIQKRSGEVWQVLAEVKKEFFSFEDLMLKAQKSIQTGLNQLDDVMGKRTRAIQRKLKNVEVIESESPSKILLGTFDDPEEN